MNGQGRNPRSRYRCFAASIDRQFDRLTPHHLRHLSLTQWTPVPAAVRVASLLCAGKNTRVLDVGAGIGKFCVIGAVSGEGNWVGVEHNEPLVESATVLARSLGVARRTRFIHGDAFSIDWSEFDALYFYNPFEMQLCGAFGAIASPAEQIARVQQRLTALDSCTRVVTLNGFGGAMPASYELLYHEVVPGVGLDLAMWIKRARRAATRITS